MNLYLVQHAKANPKEEDPEQALSNIGWSDIEKVKSFLKNNLEISVDCIFHSPKARARQTAETLAEIINSRQGTKEVEGLKPLDNPEDWIEKVKVSTDDLMIVGHRPNLSRISDNLLGFNDKEIVDFQQGGILCLERNEKNSWSIRWMIIPDLFL